MFKVNNKDTRTTLLALALLLTLSIFHFFSSVSIIDFEQVNVCWIGRAFTKKLFFWGNSPSGRAQVNGNLSEFIFNCFYLYK